MADPRRLRPDMFEILVARELRKAGLELSKFKVRARRPLSEDHDDEFAIEISVLVQIASADRRRMLVECRSERQPVQREAVQALSAKLANAEAQHALMFSASSYEAAAVREAMASGIPLLTVADGKAAFARSPWGMAGQPPAWVPDYMAEVVDLDITGELRRQLVVSGQPRLILDRLEGKGVSGER